MTLPHFAASIGPMSKIEASGYSLWLVPEGLAFLQYSAIIKRLSEENVTPNFEPHVTLLGGIDGSEEEVVDKTDQLSKLVRPYYLSFIALGREDHWSRALYLLADLTSDALAANRVAQNIFRGRVVEDYIPHLSLLYGYPSDAMKQVIMRSIFNNFPSRFEVTSIDLFKCQGRVEDWYQVEKFKLSRGV